MTTTMIAIMMMATTTPTAAPTTAPLSLLPPEHDTQHLGHCNQLRNYILFTAYYEWRWNEFESGGTGTERKWDGPDTAQSRNFFPVVPREF